MAQTKAQLLGPVVGDVVMDVSTLSLDAEGNKVGIGTTGATATLHVFEPTEGDAVVQFNSGDNFPTVNRGLVLKAATGPTGYTGSKWIFDAQSSGGRLEFQTTSTPRLTILEGGNVGIGIDNPETKLHVSDGHTASADDFDSNIVLAISKNTTVDSFAGIAINSGNNAASFIHFGDTNDSNVGRLDYSHGDNAFKFFTNGDSTERLRITSDGNIGINQTNPTRKLHITTASGSDTAGSTDSHLFFNVADDSGPGWVQRVYDSGAGSSGHDGSFAIDRQYSGSWSNAVTIKRNTGNIGVGYDSPSQKLVVKGTTSLMATNSTNVWMAYTYTDNTFRLNYNGVGSDEVIVKTDGDVRLLNNLLIREDQKIHFEDNSGDDLNAIWKGDSENTLFATSRFNIANIIDSNNDDSTAFWSVRKDGTTLAGSDELMRVQSNGRVGIGRQNPAFMLDIIGNTGANLIRIVDTAETGHGSHPAKIVAGGTYYHEMQMHGRRFAVHTYDGTSIAERFRVHQNGYIGINDTNPTRALTIKYNDSTAYSASGYTPAGGAIRIFNEATGSNTTAGEILLGAGASGTGWAAISCRRPGSQETELNFRVMDSATWNTGLTINKLAYVGIGVDSPAVKLDVKKATAGTIARFYDNGSNGGAYYSTGPVMGISRVSNGSVSQHGLLFQVGWDKNNSNSFNIDETVLGVGDKGVGVGEDDPQVMLHCSKGLSSTSSYKDAQMIRINGTNGVDTMAGIGFGYHTTNPAGSAYPSAWIGAKVSSWTQYVKHDLVFATRSVDTNTEPVERFRITEGNELKQAQDSQYWTYGNFTAGRSGQNATTAPRLAGGIAYGFGYQEAFSTSGGGWSHPYPDAVFGYHTGMRFGGHISYGGCRFYADHPSSNSSVLFSVGNGSYNVVVANTLSKGGGTFRIAHPHPSKKYTHDLQHSFIEGPQCDNIYRGKVDLVGGTASINIDTVSNMTDGTFVLLNRDIQCFTSNETGWTAVKGSVSGNILTITAKSSSCTDTISWMVIGERQDDKIKSLDMTDDDGNLIVEPLTREESHL